MRVNKLMFTASGIFLIALVGKMIDALVNGKTEFASILILIAYVFSLYNSFENGKEKKGVNAQR